MSMDLLVTYDEAARATGCTPCAIRKRLQKFGVAPVERAKTAGSLGKVRDLYRLSDVLKVAALVRPTGRPQSRPRRASRALVDDGLSWLPPGIALGDRIAVTNASHDTVIGDLVDIGDVLGHVRLKAGNLRAFGCDAIIRPAPGEELTNRLHTPEMQDPYLLIFSMGNKY